MSLCLPCRRTVLELRKATNWTGAFAKQELPRSKSDWPALATRIQSRRRRSRSLQWVVAGALAASISLIVLARSRAGETDSVPAFKSLAGASAEIERELASSEQERKVRQPDAWRETISTIDFAIAQTNTALRRDPANEILREHLTELERARVTALQDVIAVVGGRG